MAEMTIERACEILNKAKWRERGDWRPAPSQLGIREHVVTGPHWFKPIWSIDNEDAIAIATGIITQRELAALRLACEPFKEVARQYHEVHSGDERFGGLYVRVTPDSSPIHITAEHLRALLAAEQKEGKNNG